MLGHTGRLLVETIGPDNVSNSTWLHYGKTTINIPEETYFYVQMDYNSGANPAESTNEFNTPTELIVTRLS